MKTNLKVLMFTLLIGASFSADAKWFLPECLTSKIEAGFGHVATGYNFVTTGENWKAHKYAFGAGTIAITAVTAGAAFLAYKKIKSNRAKKSCNR